MYAKLISSRAWVTVDIKEYKDNLFGIKIQIDSDYGYNYAEHRQ